MSVIAKISSYFDRSVVTLKLRKEYLNTVTYNTPVLLPIKYWTVWYTERYSMSTYTEVSNFQKPVRFFGPPCTSVGRRSNRWTLFDSEPMMQILQQVGTTLMSFTTRWPTRWRRQHWPQQVIANDVIRPPDIHVSGLILVRARPLKPPVDSTILSVTNT